MINNKEILAIIPARGGSKGIPKKNIKSFNGKPLISFTIEEAKKSKYIDRIVVSTEDEEISKICQKYGAEVPYARPMELAKDDTPTIDCIIHMLKWFEENEHYVPDYVCLLQCTSPLRTSNDIDSAIDKMINLGMDGIVSICEAEVNPYWTNVFVEEKLEYFIESGKKITRRQELPKVYRVNGAIYILRTNVLLEKKTFEPDNITGHIMSPESSIDIDNSIDFKLAELIIKERENYA